MRRMWSYVSAMALVAAVLISLVSLHAEAGACNTANSAVLGNWAFDGTYDDISPLQRGPAIGAWDRSPVGGNINLQWPSDAPCAGYVHIGNPGHLEVPRVDIHNISFTFSFQVKFNGQIGLRRILYADWNTNNWQFMSWLTPDRTVSVWFRNTQQSTFVYVTSGLKVPLGVFTDIAISWDRNARLAAIYINKAFAGYQVVAANVKDIDLFKSNSYYYQFGAKADSTSVTTDYAPLDADVRNLRVWKGLVLSAPELPSLAMSH